MNIAWIHDDTSKQCLSIDYPLIIIHRGYIYIYNIYIYMGKLERSISLFDLTGIMVRIGRIIPIACPCLDW